MKRETPFATLSLCGVVIMLLTVVSVNAQQLAANASKHAAASNAGAGWSGALYSEPKRQQEKKPAGGGEASPPSTDSKAAAPSSGDAPATPTPSPSPSSSPAAPIEPAPSAPGLKAATGEAAKSTAARPGSMLPPEKANPVSIVRFEKAPVIDGKIDEDVWQSAAVFKDFIQFRPGDNIAPSKQTEVRIGYDSKFFYIAFHAYDEPDKVRATVAKRDGIFDDDWVGVALDTFHDGRRAYEFFFNPLGVQADAILTEGGNEDMSFDLVMESKGTLTPDGYTIEVAIPFKSLRYTAGKDKVWGLHLTRSIKRFNDERDSWMPLSRDNSSFLGQAGRITGLEGISTERTLELIPSLTISETGKRTRTLTRNQLSRMASPFDDGRFINRPIELEPGLTAKLGLSSTMTLDLAVNPDFAQVEADQTVITANQRFPIFFEEKRPFFLEGKEVFDTLISAVHTRAIVDPDLAVKLTGKQGRNSYGLIVASDNAPGNFSEEERADPDILPAIQPFLDKNAYIGVLRLKRDVGKENHIGLLATTYNFNQKHNHMGGFDTRVRFNKTTTFIAQVLGSTSRRAFFDRDSDAPTFRSIDGNANTYRTINGMAYAYRLERDTRHWYTEYAGVGRSRFFRADVGFNRRFNTNNQSLFVQYKSTPNPKGKIVEWRLFSANSTNFDWRGRSQRFDNNNQLRFSFQKQGFLGIGVENGYERVFDEEFCGQRVLNCRNVFFGDNERSAVRRTFYAYGGITPSKKYSLFLLNIYNWGVLDFDFGNGPRFPRVSPIAQKFGQGAPLDPGAGNQWHLESEFVYQPTGALRMTLAYTKDRLTRQDTGGRAYDDNIITLRSTYQFTRFMFARARADYDTLAANMRAQLLFGWTPNPGTAFYAGYNDDINRNGFNPFTGQLEPGLRRNGRTFFIKMSYLIRRSLGQ